MQLKINSKVTNVTSYEEASRAYRKFTVGKSSRCAQGKIFQDGVQIAYVSFNGRVWPGTDFVPGTQPIFG